MFDSSAFDVQAFSEDAFAFEAAAIPPTLLEQLPNISAAFDSGTHQYDLSEYFSGADTYAIDPAIETGWSFDANTGVLTIDTDDEDTFGPYTVTATNGSGDTDSNTFTVKVSQSSVPIYQGGDGGLIFGFALRF